MCATHIRLILKQNITGNLCKGVKVSRHDGKIEREAVEWLVSVSVWVVTEIIRSWMQTSEMSFLRQVSRLSFRDGVMSSATSHASKGAS